MNKSDIKNKLKNLNIEYKKDIKDKLVDIKKNLNEKINKLGQDKNKALISELKKDAEDEYLDYKYEKYSKFIADERMLLEEGNIKKSAFINWVKNLFHKPIYKMTSPKTDSSGRDILLEVEDASIHFKLGKKVVKACNHLNFKIYKGETFGLVGESGSGKTTISRAIIGINKLTGGNIYFKGRNISHPLKHKEEMKVKKNIQMIFQDPAASLNERANVDYIISEGLYNFHLFKDKTDRLKKVSDMLNSVGLLPEHLTRYPHEFSGGQRQRIGIARALVIEPELVLADEPISALDVSIRAQVLNLLGDLQKQKNLTYLFIAHDLSIIKYISDRIGVMHQGYLVELGLADEIYQNPIHPYTKALLTAIPQPDPKTKNIRKKIIYDMTGIDYEKCSWQEVKPGHFILTTDELRKKWLKDDEK